MGRLTLPLRTARIPRKPTCEAFSGDAHHNRFGAAPMSGFGSPADGAAFVVIFRETIRNGKLAWKKMGEARFDRHQGLCGIPWALPASAAHDLAERLRELPDSVWS